MINWLIGWIRHIGTSEIQALVAILQFFSGLLLLIVTMMYVRLTNKLARSPHKVVIAIRDVNTYRDGTNEITFRNNGPGVGVKVQLKVVFTKKFDGRVIRPKKPNRAISIEVGEEAKYHCSHNTEIEDMILIKWKTVMGESGRNYWMMAGNTGADKRIDVINSLVIDKNEIPFVDTVSTDFDSVNMGKVMMFYLLWLRTVFLSVRGRLNVKVRSKFEGLMLRCFRK